MSTSALTVAAVTQLQNVLIGILTNLHFTAPSWPGSVQVKDRDKFDFIIVGAGTAGSVLANRLSAVDDCNVLVIEAGGDPPLESVIAGGFALLPRTKYDWNYTAKFDEAFSFGHRNKVLDLTAGKLLGGSSSINHLIYGRGFPYDYDKWAELVDGDGWSYKNIYKYLLKLERLEDSDILASPDKVNHGLNGNIGTTREPHTLIKKYLDAIEEIGYDVILDTVPGLDNAQRKLAFSQLLFFIANLKRQSTAQGYLSDLKSKSNLKFLKNAFVTNVIFHEHKVATGVNVLTNDGKRLTVYANKEVILSAGVFNSPKILLLSGIGPQEDLDNLNIPVLSNLPVGENFQDHVGVLLIQTMKNLTALPGIPPPTQFPIPGMVGYVSFDKQQSYPDYEALNFVFEDELVFSLICSIIFSYDDTICDSIIDQTNGHEFYASLPSLLHPKSRGKVQLSSTNPTDKPIINAGYYSVDSDVDTMIRIIEDNIRIQNTEILKDLGAEFVNITLPACKDYALQSKEYWACYLKYMTTSHFYGTSTCAMGSVVDRYLNVYGVSNLRVVDASVIPYAMSASPEVGVIVVAERAADLIKAKYYPNSTSSSPVAAGKVL